MTCIECGEVFDHWNHADKNRAGHFFHEDDRALIAGREMPTPPQPKEPRPRKEGPMPYVVEDTKFWIRSYPKQKLVRDMALDRIRRHDLAMVRLHQANAIRKQIEEAKGAIVRGGSFGELESALDSIREAEAEIAAIEQEKPILAQLVIPADEIAMCRLLVERLTRKLEIRKRVPEERTLRG
jgi:hypothetical protein